MSHTNLVSSSRDETLVDPPTTFVGVGPESNLRLISPSQVNTSPVILPIIRPTDDVPSLFHACRLSKQLQPPFTMVQSVTKALRLFFVRGGSWWVVSFNVLKTEKEGGRKLTSVAKPKASSISLHAELNSFSSVFCSSLLSLLFYISLSYFLAKL